MVTLNLYYRSDSTFPNLTNVNFNIFLNFSIRPFFREPIFPIVKTVWAIVL